MIASRNKPHRTGDESNHCAYPKRRTPAVVNHQVSDKARAQSRSGAYPCEDPTIGNAALAPRNPTRDELTGSRVNHGLASAEKKPDAHEQVHPAPRDWRAPYGETAKHSP